jgi:hypothetical protein
MTSQELDLPPSVQITDQKEYLTVLMSLIHMNNSAVLLGAHAVARDVQAAYTNLYEQGKAVGWLNANGTVMDENMPRELVSMLATEEPRGSA